MLFCSTAERVYSEIASLKVYLLNYVRLNDVRLNDNRVDYDSNVKMLIIAGCYHSFTAFLMLAAILLLLTPLYESF